MAGASEGYGEGTVTYKLRDWLFSRQRYWGEPFPIVYDETGLPIALPESMLPVELPDVDDYSPQYVRPRRRALRARAAAGAAPSTGSTVELDLGDGPKRYRRETNTMPQWAGSCWYELRYLDPTNENAFVDPEVERYWMGPQFEGDAGGVDLYVGGVEHAVLHLLYARFWHKVLFDLGYVSSCEPFRRLFNQGYILAAAYTDERGMYVEAAEVEERDGAFFHDGQQSVHRECGKMGKSLKNAVTPDELYDEYGADTLRLYEMSMGPLDASRPWETRAVVGMYRFLQRLWRNLVDEDDRRAAGGRRRRPTTTTRRLLHRTIDGVRADMEGLRFNTAIAKLIELNNHLTGVGARPVPREVAEPLVLMLAPLAPHVAEELWARLGPRARRWPTSPSRRPTPRCWSTTPSSCRCRSTARCAAASWWPTDADDGRASRRPPGRRQGAGRLGGPDAEEGHRGARPHGLDRRLNRLVRGQVATPREATRPRNGWRRRGAAAAPQRVIRRRPRT